MNSDANIYNYFTFAYNPDRTPVATTKGEKFVGVGFIDHDGKPIHTGGWPYGHYEYRIEGNRIYKK